MTNNYDPIAGSYDFLSRLIFGRNLILAQTCLLQHIPANSHILIVGGGTGRILHEIAKIHSSGLRITYVEISEKMIRLARKYNVGQNQVNFVHIPIERFSTSHKYDIILTAFLFDNFSEERASFIFNDLSARLYENGKWLFADFYIDKKSKLWQKLLLKLMLRFFRIICKIEAKELIPMDTIFRQSSYRRIYIYDRFYNFIRSSVYTRSMLS